MKKSLPTFDELIERENLCLAQADDLRYDDGQIRLWTSRMTIGDGVPYRSTVYVERLIDGAWITIGCYDGENPPEIVGTVARHVRRSHLDLP